MILSSLFFNCKKDKTETMEYSDESENETFFGEDDEYEYYDHSYENDYEDDDYEDLPPSPLRPVRQPPPPPSCDPPMTRQPPQQPQQLPKYVVLTHGSSSHEEISIPSSPPLSSSPPPPPPPKPMAVTNPWKKVDPVVENRDPWAFLKPARSDFHFQSSSRPSKYHYSEPVREPRYPKSLLLSQPQQPQQSQQQSHHSQQQSQQPQKQQQQSQSQSQSQHRQPRSNHPPSNKLCKYAKDCRMNKEKRCTMVHTLEEWNPKVCHLNARCKRKNECGFYHTETTKEVHLSTLIKTQDTIYHKNAGLYQKYTR